MKFSKILTTAMMSAVLVASSSALATETSWWTMNFDGLAIEEGGTLTNALNNAYATTQNGWWTSEEGDLTTFENDKLKLNTQGTDLTWTPNADNDTTAITYIDADVTFVGSDAAPTVTETDVHTAVYLKNLADETTGEVTNSVLCAWVRTGTEAATWVELVGVELTDGNTYRLRIMLYDINLSFYIDGTLLTGTDGVTTKFKTAKDGFAGAVDSVSFRGTGYVDNFAASQEEKAVAAKAYVTDYAFYVDNADVTSEWSYETFMGEEFVATDLTLNGSSSQIATVWDFAQSPDDGSVLGEIAAIKLVSDDQSFEVVYDDETGTFVGDSTFVIVSNVTEDGTQYIVSVDTDELVADAEYTVEFYYGDYTPADPEPVQLDAPKVAAATTTNSVTLTWTAVTNATGYVVTFNGTTNTVTDATSFTASNLEASTEYAYSVVAKGDGESYTDSAAASGTAKTATPAEPEPEFAPVAVTDIAIDGTTVTLTIEGEYTEVKVLFCETLGGEWVEVEATFADGVATVPATTDTGFFKVEAK